MLEPSETVSRRRRTDGELTAKRVLDAATECILQLGYYQASSNEIARRAGVTWGVIQHQFGTREGLLLAVLNDRWATMEAHMASADVSGKSLQDRLTRVFDVLAEHYGAPEHLVQLQIILDLTHNPKTSTETRRAVAAHGEALTRAWQPLFEGALGEAARETDLVRYAFLTLRGYLQGGIISAHIADTTDDTVQRRLLIEGVAASIQAEAGRRGIELG
ncbi:MAG TPA: TetR/AcrR family transcriptional regulator [Frankiaceae bacterium]|jgi:AcrR family transcriptional regulator|nr:TetR/AcrR family transcriptional regulator [Frankiaceae bacterium]